MHLTPFRVTGDFNISDSTSNSTSDPCSYVFSSCLFFNLHFTTMKEISNGLCEHDLAAPVEVPKLKQ